MKTVHTASSRHTIQMGAIMVGVGASTMTRTLRWVERRPH